MCPTPRAPISTTTASASSGALAKVRGTPSSLLNDRSLAATMSKRTASTAARRSLTVVLPTDPVIPTMRPGSRRRAAKPMLANACTVSSTSMAVPPTPACWVR